MSTALAATFFYLLHNDDCLERLTNEVRNTFSDVEEIRSGARLNSCRYLRACIDESMRCSPPVPGLMPREVLEGGMEIDGHHFVRGVEVGVPHYALHHNEAYFRDPFDFLPSRWLLGESGPDGRAMTTQASIELAQSAFCPFSLGPRQCLGRGAAYMEMSIVLARVVWLYDMRLAQARNGSAAPSSASVFTAAASDHYPFSPPTSEKGKQRRDAEYRLVDTLVSKGEGPLVEFKRRMPS